MKNPNNREGPWLPRPKGSYLVKSSQGFTRVGDVDSTYPLDHVDSPLTPSTNRKNLGVSINGSPKTK